MFLFSLLIFPIYFAFDYFQTKTYDTELAKTKFFLFIQGIFVSAIFISLMALLASYEQMNSLNIFQNFLVKSLYDVVFPLLFSCLYFILLYKNLRFIDKKSLLSYFLGFYTCYLFYGLYTNPIAEQFFYLFCKPFLFLVSFIAFGYLLPATFSFWNEKKISFFLLSILLEITILLFPILIESFWFVKISILWLILLVCVYLFLLFFFSWNLLKKQKI